MVCNCFTIKDKLLRKRILRINKNTENTAYIQKAGSNVIQTFKIVDSTLLKTHLNHAPVDHY